MDGRLTKSVSHINVLVDNLQTYNYLHYRSLNILYAFFKKSHINLSCKLHIPEPKYSLICLKNINCLLDFKSFVQVAYHFLYHLQGLKQ